MDLTTILDMAAEGMPDRVLVGTRATGLTAQELSRRSRVAGAAVARSGADTVVYLGVNGPPFPVALFAASYAGVPFLPVNYRLGQDQLDAILASQVAPLVISDSELSRFPQFPRLGTAELLAMTDDGSVDGEDLVSEADAEAVAVLLMTSGTTAAPKSAVLRNRHLTSYVFGTVDFAGAEEDEATLVSVPPYHIAAVANLLSNLFAGRRIVYLDHFTAADWLETVERESITHAMLVPTMLVRIVDELVKRGQDGPACLRSISYGGAKVATPVLIEALARFPHAGFVNAYGLTETASSIALLGPEDHRVAYASADPAVRARLGSVGQALPSVDIEIHDEDGQPCPPGVPGSIVVRGPQVAGEYLETGASAGVDAWFATRDLGYMDEGGFIFVLGRADDTIIRGGENIAPSEIESVLAQHEWVADVAVAGVPDEEWGQRIAAFVVLKPAAVPDADVLRDYVRGRLRSSKTPDEIVFLAELPTSPTGKILRRELVGLVVDGPRTVDA